jgi:hypothetical protein
MNPKDPNKERRPEKKTEPRHDERESPERTSAPPIEREHETYAGVIEEDERREREEEDERRERERS